jgi:hypothetical protein
MPRPPSHPHTQSLFFAFEYFDHTGALGAQPKEECLSKLILFGENTLRRALGEFVEHFHVHQGKDNLLLFPADEQQNVGVGTIACRERLGRMSCLTVRAAG